MDLGLIAGVISESLGGSKNAWEFSSRGAFPSKDPQFLAAIRGNALKGRGGAPW